MQPLPRSLRIGVIRGGPSPEYEISIKTGGEVLLHLSETHDPVDIFISRDGKWHMNGVERSPERILKQVDVIFNAMHGNFGEDGGIQDILNHHGIPYTGSEKYESATAVNKWVTKERLKSLGIKTPVAMIVRREDNLIEKAKEVWSSIPNPLVVKPTCGGSSLSLYVARSFKELLSSLENILEIHGSAIVEEYIEGKQAGCLVVDDFRGQETYAFPPSVALLKNETQEIENISKTVHEQLGLRHYSNSDFIVSPKRGIYFLEVNTVPKMGEKSLLHKSIESVGVTVKDFLHHLIGLAIRKSA